MIVHEVLYFYTMRKNAILYFFLLFLINTYGKEYKLVESSSTKNDKNHAFKKYLFKNGLTVILHEDHSDPLVCVNVSYKVGSKNEKKNEFGYAHFYEHMMFQGSKNLPNGLIWQLYPLNDKIIMNANTSYDVTNYFELIPSNYLETALWAEADRMIYMDEYISESLFNIQRDVILNEMKETNDFNPYASITSNKYKYIYGADNPYAHEIIGTQNSLNQATTTEIIDFYKNWYAPNNAIISIAGDFNTNEVLDLIEKYFGSIPATEINHTTVYKYEGLKKDAFYSVKANITYPTYLISFPTVKRGHEDEPALDALAYIMENSNTSHAYATSFDPSLENISYNLEILNPCLNDIGTFDITFLSAEALSSEYINDALNATLKKFNKEGFLEEILEEFKVYMNNRNIVENESILNKALNFSATEMSFGSPDIYAIDKERYNNVTEQDVLRVFNKYLYKKHKLILQYIPINENAPKEKKTLYNKNYSYINKIDTLSQIATAIIPLKDTFDRSLFPKIQPVKTDYQQNKLWIHTANDLFNVLGFYYDEVPLSIVEINIEAGNKYIPLQKLGLSAILLNILNSAETKYSTYLDVYEDLKSLGAQMEFDVNNEDFIIRISAPNENIHDALGVLESLLENVNIEDYTVNQTRSSLKSVIDNFKNQNPFFIAYTLLNSKVYSDSTYQAYTVLGTKSKLDNVTTKDVLVYLKNYLLKGKLTVNYVGSLNKDAVLKMVDFLNTEKKIIKPIYDSLVYSNIPTKKIYIYDDVDLNQSHVLFYYKSIPYSNSKDFVILELFNFILGGSFSSKLNQQLREELGYTYGVSAITPIETSDDVLKIYIPINKEKTKIAIDKVINTMTSTVNDGITQEELDLAKKSFLSTEFAQFENINGKLDYLNLLRKNNNDVNVLIDKNKILLNLTLEEVNQKIKEMINPNNIAIFLLTDKEYYEKL